MQEYGFLQLLFKFPLDPLDGHGFFCVDFGFFHLLVF